MSKRRSLTDALELSPEAVAFIESGKPAAPRPPRQQRVRATPPAPEANSTRSVPAPRDRPESQDDAESLSVNPSKQPDDAEPVAPQTNRRLRRKGRADTQPDEPEMWVPITTRVKKSTSRALTRAYLEQKLQGEQPATQQAIVEEALRAWLTNRQYL